MTCAAAPEQAGKPLFLERDLIDVEDEFDTVRYLVEAAFNASRYASHNGIDGRAFDVAAMFATEKLIALGDQIGGLRRRYRESFCETDGAGRLSEAQGEQDGAPVASGDAQAQQ